ncbi:MAG: DNRLRE domain-containing protein [Phycisphaerales bacterium]|nr:DNRLRE domain-containing protein [Phycisphaerales bacterium]
MRTSPAATILAAVLLCAGAGSRAAAQRFTVVALPDTQFYSEHPEWTYHFEAQTQWCVDHRDEWDIAFVTQLGDVVQHGSEVGEWQRADSSVDILDGLVPYSVAMGNHDWASTGNKDASTANFRAYFGAQRYAGYPWYGGADPTGISHYQLFECGAYQVLHLALEWKPDWKSASIAWAQSVIDAHPGVPTMISTHEYMTDEADGHHSASGENQFNRLVRGNDQVFMVLNGHYTQGATRGEYHRTRLNDYGRTVIEMLADYQARTEGGDGWMRLIEFLPDEDRIEVYTHSPSREARGLSAWENDANSRFGFDIDFRSRFMPAQNLVAERTVAFRQGEGGYVHASDTTVRESDQFRTFSRDPEVWIDGDDPGGSGLDSQGLLRFDQLAGAGGVPEDSDILSAVLELRVTNGGSGIGWHRTRVAWGDTATWASLGGGVQADGSDAWARWDHRLNSVNEGLLSVDVTSSLRSALLDGPETGWALLPLGDDGVGVASGEAADASTRPRLVVRVADEPVRTARFQQGVGGYQGTLDTELRAINPDTPFGDAPTAMVDAQYNFFKAQALLRFDGVFGPGGVPADPTTKITSAMLRLRVTEPGSGLTLHRAKRGWDEGDTWNSLAGGLQADGVDALDVPTQSAGANGDGEYVGAGVYSFDVTADVLAWREGAPNLGWSLLPWASGIDGVSFAASEWPVAGERPELIVRYVGGCTADFNGDGTINTHDLLAFLNAWASGDMSADVNRDGAVNTQDVLAYLNLWAAGC